MKTEEKRSSVFSGGDLWKKVQLVYSEVIRHLWSETFGKNVWKGL